MSLIFSKFGNETRIIVDYEAQTDSVSNEIVGFSFIMFVVRMSKVKDLSHELCRELIGFRSVRMARGRSVDQLNCSFPDLQVCWSVDL